MSAAAQTVRSHAALTWIIRGTGVLIAIPTALLAIFSLIGMPLLMIVGSHHAAKGGWLPVLGLALMMVLGLFYGAIAKVGYDMFRKINTTAVANFAFIFSFLTAYSLYHVLPVNLPGFLAKHFAADTPFFAQGSEPGFSYRATLAFVTFLVFYNLVKSYFLRTLELNPFPSRETPPDDLDIPEYPQKSPLRPL